MLSSSLLSSVTPSQSVSTNSLLNQNSCTFHIPEKDEIWSGILKNVASSKMVPTKNVLILGEPGVGKSTLVHYLKNDPGPIFETEEQQHLQGPHINVNTYTNTATASTTNGAKRDKNDLALGYTFVDVADEENEVMARLGLYQLALSSPEFLPLLKFATSSETISDSCVLILMDWARPWKFVETLQTWINILDHLTSEILKEGSNTNTTSDWSKGKVIMEELREKLEHYLQTYTEPTIINKSSGLAPTASTSTNSIIVDSSTSSSLVSTTAGISTMTANNIPIGNTPATTISTVPVDQVILPLTTGCLTHNLGIPITIVCCKSDALNTLEQTHDYKEDQFDYIQQTLRCICMKYGASLFYTSTMFPYTFHNLRQYILHRVLSTPTKPYPFKVKAQVIERDTVLVPAGWDSWGKIKVLKEGFDCELLNESWDADMETVKDRHKPGRLGARGTFEEAIATSADMLEIQPQHIPTTTICENEQVFFERHYETLKKAQELQNGGGHPHHRHVNGSNSAAAYHKPGVTGSLGVPNDTFDLMRSNLDDTSRSRKDLTSLKINHAAGTNNLSSSTNISSSSSIASATVTSPQANTTASNSSTNTPLTPISPHSTHSNGSSMTTSMGSSATTTTAAAAAAAAAANQNGGPSHEVLANFFQSLLSKKTPSVNTSGASSPTIVSSPTSLSGPNSGQPNGRSSGGGEDGGFSRRQGGFVSRKDVHKELDRMRQYTASSK